MCGTCLKSGSMSNYCPVWSVPTLNTRFDNRRLFTSESSNPSVPMSFAEYLELRRLSTCLSPSSSDKHTSHRLALPFSHLDLDCGTMLRCVCLFGSLLTLHRSDSHSQVARCAKHLEFRTCSWPIRQLCLRHNCDDLLQEVWCKWVSLGCSLEMCSADVVVSQLQRFRHQDWDKNLHRFKRWHCREQLRSG